MCVYVCMYVCVYTYMYTYTYVYIHTYIHINIYIYTNIYTYKHKHVHIYSGPGELSRYSDSLRAGRSGYRIPVEARFSAPVQTHSASYTRGTGSFPGVKRPGRGVDHPLPSRTEVKERVELYLFSTHGLSWPALGWTLPLTLPCCGVEYFTSNHCIASENVGDIRL
jgi:hypothetical protein